MITEIVLIDLPKGISRHQALEMYRQTAELWRNNPDLIEKYYFFDETSSIGGGVYFWPSRKEAEVWHGPAYKEKVLAVYGVIPSIQIFDNLIHIAPSSKIYHEIPTQP